MWLLICGCREKGYHGTPSGIDNTASTYGGLLRFQRTDGDPIFEPTALPTPCRIVYASTGITASTSEVVGDVRTARETDPARYAELEQQYLTQVLQPAEKALQQVCYLQRTCVVFKCSSYADSLTDAILIICRGTGRRSVKLPTRTIHCCSSSPSLVSSLIH